MPRSGIHSRITITISDSLQLLNSARLDQFNAGEYIVPKNPTNQRKSLKSGVYFRIRHGGHCGRYEPRFKPPRERLPSGKPLVHDYLPLGGYDTLEDAKVVRQIAAFYYGKAEPHLDLGDGRQFAIDSSWNEQLDFRRGKEKAKWVASQAKEVFQDFKKAKDSWGLWNASNNHTSVIPSGEQIANACDPSHAGFLSPAICKSPENLAPSSRTTLPVTSNPGEEWVSEPVLVEGEQWFSKTVLDEGDGVLNKELSGDVEYFPVSSPSLVTQDSIEPTFSALGLLERTELLSAYLEDLSEKQFLENEESWLNDFLSSCPGSVSNANGHPQCSAVNATADEQCASLFEPDGPCSPVVEVTTLKENQGSYVEAAISDKVSLDITTVPVEGALPDSQGLQSVQDGMDVGAPLSDPSFCSELSIEYHLSKVSSFHQQKCENYKRRISELERENCERRRISELECESYERRISELEREVKRLKGKSPMSFDA